ncbi:MAG: hypothetical protein GW802_08570 [Armatimonadetes bacterium]|nr:hypothetical protein [Armatimonadota bacterium]
MPYKNEGWWAFPAVVYLPPEDTSQPEWRAKHGLGAAGLAAGQWKQLPQARAVELQAINDFHRFDPMEVPATASEREQFLAGVSDQSLVLFPEDRRYPIRMVDELPVRWTQTTAEQRATLHGEAQRGEYYAFQLGVFANGATLEDVRVEYTDLRSGGGEVLPASALTCFNLGGVDCLGQPLRKRVNVPQGHVQALWFGVQVPSETAATTYEGTVSVSAANAPPQTAKLSLAIAKEAIANAGDDDLWRQSRLRWLNSTIGLDDEVFAPYEPVGLEGSTVHVLGRQLRFGPTGLPESIQSTFSPSVDSTAAPPHEVLAAPVRFVVQRDGGVVPQWRPKGIDSSQPGTGAAEWAVVSQAPGFELSCRAKMECDGYVNYVLTLRAEQATEVADLTLEIPFRRDVARYMIGMGRKGGVRPEKWDWQWDLSRANSHVWLGDVNAGLQCKLKNVAPHWGLYGLQDVGLYRDWVGEGKGGCTIREDGDAVVRRAFTGPMALEAGRELHFNFGLLVTPLKVLDKRHWYWRYFHKSAAEPVPAVAQTGASILNLHQGAGLNPHINYPFRTADKLAAYTREAHDADMKVKIYYTVRELSNYTAEFWALRSLGNELFRDGPGFRLADQGRAAKDTDSLPRMGSSWLCEHAITGYVPAWHQPLGNGNYDAAIAQQGLSRWHNYYTREGLSYLIKHVGIDGLYLDGIGYDREIMKRVRKMMQRANPGCLIDFHSGNNFHPEYGLNNVAGQYMELFPCMDSLWFGEGFDYDESPDYWLVEISGMPFGLFGEMLQGGGNPWRGMVYGMSNRLGWGGDPRPLWKVWDDFGIDQARMVGYWDPACPVRTGRDDVLATAYVRKGKMLVSVASWAPEPVRCKLDINLQSIGLSADRAHFYAPPIEGFQPPALFDYGTEIPVPSKRGWLLIVDDQPHELPVGATNDPFAGRKLLLQDRFEGTSLGEGWAQRLSKRPDTSVTVKGAALHFAVAANSVAFAQRPVPEGTAGVVCTVDQGSDQGATWGPGLALVWPDGRALRVNLRAEGRFGVYGYQREILGGLRYPGDAYELAVILDAETIRALAGQGARLWQTLAEIPRTAFPGAPVAVRLGKMGMPAHEQDFETPGPGGACSIRAFRVYAATTDAE